MSMCLLLNVFNGKEKLISLLVAEHRQFMGSHDTQYNVKLHP